MRKEVSYMYNSPIPEIDETVPLIRLKSAFEQGAESALESDLFNAALVGVALSLAVYCEGCFFNCSFKGGLLGKPVDLALGTRPDFAYVSSHNSLRSTLFRIKRHIKLRKSKTLSTIFGFCWIMLAKAFE